MLRVPAWLAISGLVWIATLVVGTVLMLRHDFRNGGQPVSASERWPSGIPLPRQDGLATLVMAVHPCCPCTRASVDQLERLLLRSPRPVKATALVFAAPGLEEDRIGNELEQRIAAIPGLAIVADADGRIADALGLTTSGATALYDGDGRLRFLGGLTSARGSSVPGLGVEAVLAVLGGSGVPDRTMPVFGCSLREVP